MFKRAFVSHSTQDGLTLGLGAVWHFDQVYQVDLIETNQEADWLARLPEEARSAGLAEPFRSSALWPTLARG